MKRRIFGIIFAVLSVGLIAVSMILHLHDDASLVWIAMFAPAGAFGYIAARLLGVRTWLGFVVPSTVLLICVPFVYGMPLWWFGGGGIIIYFAVFYCLMIVGGWALVCLPVIISDHKCMASGRDRIFDTARLCILFVLVCAALLYVLNLCFGNPITAYIAGEEMKDYLSDQADDGKYYEIMERILPKYGWYNVEYTFDITDGSSRYVIHWKDGEIRIDSGRW